MAEKPAISIICLKVARRDRMPRYSSEIDYIIDEDAFAKLFNSSTNNTDRTWITILWLTGARPAEVLELQKKNIKFLEDGRILFDLSTKKLGKKGQFVVRRRKLILKVSQDSRYIKTIKYHLNRLKHEDQKIFSFSRRTGYNVIDRLGIDALGISLCPYNFRHSRLTLMAEKGATEGELMRIKGSMSRQSVKPYLHARKVEYDVEMEI